MKKSILFLTATLVFCIENNSKAQDTLSTSEMACKSNMVALNVTPILVTLIGAETKNFGVGLNYRRILNDQYRIRADVNVYTNKSENQMSYAIYADSTRNFDNAYFENERFDFSLGLEKGKKINSVYLFGGVQVHFQHSFMVHDNLYFSTISAQAMNAIQLPQGTTVQYSTDSISQAPQSKDYVSFQRNNGIGIQIPIGFSYLLTDNFSIQLETTLLARLDKTKQITSELNSTIRTYKTFSTFNFDFVPLKFFLAYRF